MGPFLPSILLPFALRARRAASEPGSPFVQALPWTRTHRTGLALTGVGLLAVLGTPLLVKPWLVVALAIYALNVAVALFIQRPRLRRLIGLRAHRDDLAWRAPARQQRDLSYAMAGPVGTIGFLMRAKPDLW